MGKNVVADRLIETFGPPSALTVGIGRRNLQRNASYTFCP
jgi:hypothetical protein